jgi:large subunit ribosomal protein L21
MYAVIRTGGKQYRVTAGDILEVEKLGGAVGDTITLDDVLMVSSDDEVSVGQPIVDGASVTAKITGQYRGKKIMVFRYRPKKRIRVRKGHRQYLTRLEIESITAHGDTFTRPVSQTTPPVLDEDPAEAESIDETTAATNMEETPADEPIAEPVSSTDDSNVAVQEDFDAEVTGDESDSQETDSAENPDVEETDSDK